MANDDKTPDPQTGSDAPEVTADSGSGLTQDSSPANHASDTEQTEPKPAASNGPSQAQQTRRAPWWLTAILALLLVLAGGTLYLGWTEWQKERQARTALQASLNAQISQLERRLEELTQSQRTQSRETAGTQERLATTETRLVELAQQLNQARAVQASDIERLEIEYLLRNARHVSLLNQDIDRALQLLGQADTQLDAMNNLAYLPVREALAVDIQRLRELPQPDVDGLYFELQALSDRALDWDWWPQTTPAGDDPETRTDAPDGGVDTWLDRAWQEVRGLVTVRYRADTEPTRLAPETFRQMQTQFQLFLQQAQVALIQRNEGLFRASMEQARSWLARGAGQVPESRWLLNRLDQLAETPVALDIPQVNRALLALEELDSADVESTPVPDEEATE